VAAIRYLWFGQPKNLNKNQGTLMNADKTRINADRIGIISALVAEGAVIPPLT